MLRLSRVELIHYNFGSARFLGHVLSRFTDLLDIE